MDKFLVGLAILTLGGYLVLAAVRPSAASEGLNATAEMFAQSLPWIIVSMFTAGLLAQFIDPAVIARFLGRDAGFLGIVIGALLGLAGTGSRWAVYPLAAGMIAAKASPGAVFSFMTSWQLISLSRLPAEIPFFGLEFTIVRALVSLFISVIGGVIVEWFATAKPL